LAAPLLAIGLKASQDIHPQDRPSAQGLVGIVDVFLVCPLWRCNQKFGNPSAQIGPARRYFDNRAFVGGNPAPVYRRGGLQCAGAYHQNGNSQYWHNSITKRHNLFFQSLPWKNRRADILQTIPRVLIGAL
jgi:hypothetical protein